MKIKLLASVLILIGLIAFFWFSNFNSSIDERESLTLLTNTISHDKLYNSFTTFECLSFHNTETTKEYYIFNIHEIHNNDCKGAPNTQPRIDTFKIMRQTENIFYYDILEDAYFPYSTSKLKR